MFCWNVFCCCGWGKTCCCPPDGWGKTCCCPPDGWGKTCCCPPDGPGAADLAPASVWLTTLVRACTKSGLLKSMLLLVVGIGCLACVPNFPCSCLPLHRFSTFLHHPSIQILQSGFILLSGWEGACFLPGGWKNLQFMFLLQKPFLWKSRPISGPLSRPWTAPPPRGLGGRPAPACWLAVCYRARTSFKAEMVLSFTLPSASAFAL